jgi:hypothetical protein
LFFCLRGEQFSLIILSSEREDPPIEQTEEAGSESVGCRTLFLQLHGLKSIAGNNIDTYCGSLRIPEDSPSIFTYGINSYNESDDVAQYPQGSDVSVSVIRDENHYTLEVAFPWEALEETPETLSLAVRWVLVWR